MGRVGGGLQNGGIGRLREELAGLCVGGGCTPEGEEGQEGG